MKKLYKIKSKFKMSLGKYMIKWSLGLYFFGSVKNTIINYKTC